MEPSMFVKKKKTIDIVYVQNEKETSSKIMWEKIAEKA